MSRVYLGMYGQAAQAHKMDVPKNLDLLKSSGVFNGTSVHLMNPWCQDPDSPWYPWPWNGDKFNLKRWNQPWFDLVRDNAIEHLKRGMHLHVCLNDRYFKASYLKKMRFQKHPFIHNNVGIDLSGSERAIYDGIQFGPVRYLMVDWDHGDQPVNALGRIWLEYIERVFDALSQARSKYPKRGVLSWKRVNETIGETSGDRPELHLICKKIAAAAGLEQGRRFKSANDYNANEDRLYRGAYKGTIGVPMRASMIEVHNVGHKYAGNMVLWQYFTDVLGFKPRRFFPSTDGVQVKEGHLDACRELLRAPLPQVDLKQEETNYPQFRFGKNMQRNFDNFVPPFIDDLLK